MEAKMTFFCIFVLGHILGDFYLQTNKMSNKKNECKKVFYIHCCLYSVISFICLIPILNINLLIPFLFIVFTHFLIDLLKKILINNKKIEDNFFVFCVDQILHILVILIISNFYYQTCKMNAVGIIICNWFSGLLPEYLYNNFLQFLVLVLFNIKPAGIFIKKFNRQNKLENNNQENNNQENNYANGGMIIGALERLIVIWLLLLKQYAAIALVLTAKSITRYKGINEDKFFSDYYLIGTLLSLFIAITSSLLLL